MGVIADEVLLHNGEVIGIIPIFLVDRELSHPNLTRLEVVHSMSVRKKMIELGNCYIAFTGWSRNIRGNFRSYFMGKNRSASKSVRLIECRITGILSSISNSSATC